MLMLVYFHSLNKLMTMNWEISSIVSCVSAMFHIPFGGAMC